MSEGQGGSLCCGCSLRTVALAIGIFHLVSAVVGIILFVVALVLSDGQEEEEDMIYINITLIIACIVALILAIVLLVGVTKKKPKVIRIWIYIQIVLVSLALFGLISNLITSCCNTHGISKSLAGVTIATYFIVVVKSYVRQLESRGDDTCNLVKEDDNLVE